MEASPTVLFTSEGLPNVDALRTFDTTTIIDPIIKNKNIYFVLVEFDITMEDLSVRCSNLWPLTRLFRV